VQVGRFDTVGKAYDVYVRGNNAYVASGDRGMYILDVSNPSNISRISLVDTPGNATSVYVQGSYAYIADEANGLVVIDVSKPAQPKIVYDSPWINEIRSATF